jgi:beta-glucosidase/6-phospho-beta-glucosidase/beta-galactosidase
MQTLPVDPHCRFPDDFIWCAATCPFQIEAAAHADGNAPSIWVLRLHRDWPVPPLYGKENGAAFHDERVDGSTQQRPMPQPAGA